MKISRFEFEIISAIFQFIFGILLHYTYKWSNYNTFIGLYSSIDDTRLSHAGMIILPSILFTNLIYIYFTFFSKNENIIIKEENTSLLEEAKEVIEIQEKKEMDVWFSRSFSLNVSLIITNLLYTFYSEIFNINQWLSFGVNFFIIIIGNLISYMLSNKIHNTAFNTLFGSYINICILLTFLTLNMKKIVDLN